MYLGFAARVLGITLTVRDNEFTFALWQAIKEKAAQLATEGRVPTADESRAEVLAVLRANDRFSSIELASGALEFYCRELSALTAEKAAVSGAEEKGTARVAT